MSRSFDAAIVAECVRLGVRRGELVRYAELGLVLVGGGASAADVAARVRRIRRLRRDLGLSYDAIELILRLVDRIEALEGGQAVWDRTGAVRVLPL